MGLIETLVLGGYLYTTAAFAWLFRRVEKYAHNHMAHLEARITALEKRLDGDSRGA